MTGPRHGAHRPYADRTAAGHAVAAVLRRRFARPRPTVLALPRGGLPVAAVVADQLTAPLAVVVVRKIGAPGRPELAVGAVAGIAQHRAVFRHEELLQRLSIGAEQFAIARAEQEAELARRLALFDSDPLELHEADVIMIDDGLATGSTMRAAVSVVRAAAPASIVVAVPVGARSAVQALGPLVDDVICVRQPEPFEAVGYAYADFRQVSEAEALALLRRRACD